jgi:hypothetical protein
MDLALAIFRVRFFYALKKTQKLLMPVPLMAMAEDLSAQRIICRKQ